jgi:hypothetical protein
VVLPDGSGVEELGGVLCERIAISRIDRQTLKCPATEVPSPLMGFQKLFWLSFAPPEAGRGLSGIQ